MKNNTKNLEQVKEFVKRATGTCSPKSKVTGEYIYTNPNLFTGRLSKESFRKSDTFCVRFNIELVFLLLSKYNINPNKITFVGDDADKKKMWVEHFGVRYIDYREETLKDMKFTYTLMNPAFDISIDALEQAISITTEKVLFIGPTRDFDKKKMLTNLEYFEPLGSKAFDENIMTAMAVYNVNGTNDTEIKFADGTKDTVSNIQLVPSTNNKEEWQFACDTISKGLPGYQAQIGKLEYGKAKEDVNGTLCIFTVGKENSKEWGNHKYIPNDQLPLTKGLGKHKLVVSKTGSIGKIGALKYAGPEVVCGFGAYFIEFNSKQDVLDAIDYIKSEPVSKLVKGIKSNTVVNGQRIWSAIPKMEFKDQWI
tara:strand:+ start:2232 stop:3329 length:1098 start_codon:yes stop_codon:yes gene_type:complete